MAGGISDRINLLLLGRTGNGKSSTGNSILGMKVFTPQSSTSSVVTYDVKAGTASINGVSVTVVEGPGLGDTDVDVTDDGQSMNGLSEKALSLISHKLHALIVVLKYGVRFTNQEKEAVKMIKTIFGEDVIKNYGIIVMTYGDSCELDMESDGVTFEKWCDDQTGDIRALFDECDKRCVLFDNRSSSAEKKEKQRKQLLNLVSGIMQKKLPYNEDDFLKAESGRKTLVVKGKLPEMKLKTESLLSEIDRRIENIATSEPTKKLEELREMTLQLEAHKSFLNTEDMGTGLVRHLLTNVSITETRIQTLISSQILRMSHDGILRADKQKETEKGGFQEIGADKDKKDGPAVSWKDIFIRVAVVLGVVGLGWVVKTRFLKRMIK